MKLYLWGTGCGAGETIQKGLDPQTITGFIDSHPAGETFLGRPVFLPEQIKPEEPDLILVTTRQADQVAETCRQLQIPEEKLLFLKDTGKLLDRNAGCTAKDLLEPSLLEALLPRQYAVTEAAALKNHILSYENDYVRLGTLELIAGRLSHVPGAMAELGVYKGGFSACMNRLLPQRKLYLFDSFEGFRPEEGKREKAEGSCSEGFLAAHRNTAADQVMKAMPYPESVILMPGFFPESLHGLEETFCLVSLDADLRDSTLSGLRYFYPRLAPGGYLMLHDWGSEKLTGVREALKIYQVEIGEILASVPIPDIGTSLIIQKTHN